MSEKKKKQNDVDPIEESREHDIQELAAVLLDEFAAVTRAADHLHDTSPAARALSDADLLKVLAQLRVGRAVDDLTGAFIDLKEQEARAARDLLDELDDDGDLDEDEDEDFDDEEDEDDFDDFDEEFDDDEEDDEEDEEEEAEDEEFDVDDFGEYIDPDHDDDRT